MSSAAAGPKGARLGGGASSGQRWYSFARALVAGFCRIYWRVQIEGRERVPERGAFVLAPVHRSNVDTLLCGCLTRRRLRFMGKDSLWKYPASGALLSSLGGIPVRRGTADREALRASEQAIKDGEPVVLFPEGTRRSGPVVQPILEGAVFVAARAGVPIVPVGIGGSEWAMRKGSFLLLPVKVALVVGNPIAPPALSAGGRVPRQELTRVSAELHKELQELFDRALMLAGRSSPPAEGSSPPGEA